MNFMLWFQLIRIYVPSTKPLCVITINLVYNFSLITYLIISVIFSLCYIPSIEVDILMLRHWKYLRQFNFLDLYLKLCILNQYNGFLWNQNYCSLLWSLFHYSILMSVDSSKSSVCVSLHACSLFGYCRCYILLCVIPDNGFSKSFFFIQLSHQGCVVCCVFSY